MPGDNACKEIFRWDSYIVLVRNYRHCCLVPGEWASAEPGVSFHGVLWDGSEEVQPEATLECVVAGGDYGHESLEARRLDFVECSSDTV